MSLLAKSKLERSGRQRSRNRRNKPRKRKWHRATFEKWGLDGAKPVQSQEQDSSGTVRKIVEQTPSNQLFSFFLYG